MHKPWSQDEYTQAYLFAARAHKCKQWPGDLDLNYMVHVDLVCMEIIMTLQSESGHDGDLAVKCALLHDVIEDTKISYEKIQTDFGLRVADGVKALSKNPDLDKPLQMTDCLSRIQLQPYEIWMVKMADRIANLRQPPIDWNKDKIIKYKDEAIEIHARLKHASEFLAARLSTRIQSYSKFIT